jgi:hypothetical protein
MTSAKPPLSVSFHNFWGGFVPSKSFLARALGDSFDLSFDAAGRDLQISSVFGSQQLPRPPTGRPLRVWFSGEARDPVAQFYDLYFAFRASHTMLGRRWHRFPRWVTYIDWWQPDTPRSLDRLIAPRSATPRPRFCNFIYTNPVSIRAEFFLTLDALRRVDSFGAILNNTGQRPRGLDGKMQVLEQSQFTIAFENQIAPGYVTEKLVEPLIAGSIPIYWGDEQAKSDFNPAAFIFADDHGSIDDLARHVLRVTDSADAMAALAGAPPLRDNRVPYEHTPAFFVDRIKDALGGKAAPLLSDHLIRQHFLRPDPPGVWFERKVRAASRAARAKLSALRGR